MTQLEFRDIIVSGRQSPEGRWRPVHQPIPALSLPVAGKHWVRYGTGIEKKYLGNAAYLFLSAPIQSVFNLLEFLLHRKRIERTELVAPPVFVLGHWRNGTTYLHNLLCKDPNHTCPRAYQTLIPGSFLLRRLNRFVRNRQPVYNTRPMDNVAFSLMEPWEDEFILHALTGLSPYARVLFPKSLGPLRGYRYPDWQSAAEVRTWQQALIRLLKRLTVHERKQVVLKSPPHTGRIRELLEIFPEAKFIHIIRHPYDVFCSNLKLWRDAFRLSFLQDVTEMEVIEMVLATYEQVYERYHRDKRLIASSQLVELKYEELIADPLHQLEAIYRRLKLPGFAQSRPRMKTYLESLGHYRRNRFVLSDSFKKTLRERWRFTFEIYGYLG